MMQGARIQDRCLTSISRNRAVWCSDGCAPRSGNVASAGAKVLPWSEKLAFAANWVAQKLLGPSRVAPYYPDFKQAFNHFCLHAGKQPACVLGGLSRVLELIDTGLAMWECCLASAMLRTLVY